MRRSGVRFPWAAPFRRLVWPDSAPSVAPECRLRFALQIDGDVVADLDGDVVDSGAGERERSLAVRSDGLAAIASDVGALTAQREVERLDRQVRGSDDFTSGVEPCRSGRGWPVGTLFGEVDADRGGAGGKFDSREVLFAFPEPVVHVMQSPGF